MRLLTAIAVAASLALPATARVHLHHDSDYPVTIIRPGA